jgi:Phosphodiester glycosidase
MRRLGLARAGVVGAIGLLVVGAGLPPASVSTVQAGVRRSTRRVAPGVRLVRIVNSRGPMHTFELRINPRKAVTLDVAMPRSTLGAYARVSSIASANGAIAAVNGDFGHSPGRPIHAFAQDGSIIQTGIRAAGDGFAESKDETHGYIGHPAINIKAHDRASNKDLTIDEWNSGPPGAGQIAAYSPEGGSVESPPRDACSARLMPSGKLSWGTGNQRVAREYAVDRVACSSSTAMSLQGGLVLSANQGGVAAQQITALNAGEAVTLTWTFGWTDVLDSLGGQPQIVANGNIVAPSGCGYICERQPRTAVGLTTKGIVIVAVVDGRAPGYSIGVTLTQLARFMRKEGAVRALNLDGGGSSEMLVKGKIVNRPSDGSERPITNALLLLPHVDSNEVLRPVAAPELASPLDSLAAAHAAASDPASTGGLRSLGH